MTDEHPIRQPGQSNAAQPPPSNAEDLMLRGSCEAEDPATTPSVQRFTLDEGKARNWLRHAAAAYMADEYGEEPTGILEGPRPEGELPEIYDDWNPEAPGNEGDVYQVVRCAVDAGVIGKPATPPYPGSAGASAPGDWDLDFEYVDDSDGGYYNFLVWVGLRLKLATPTAEMRKLGEREAVGVAAALAILTEAVASANRALEALDEYVADRVA